MEQLLHYVWKHKLFPLKPLHTTTGQKVEIIDPGLSNPDAGPDFFNAKIKLDGVIWVGNVEIHERLPTGNAITTTRIRLTIRSFCMRPPTLMPK